jgi:hypothetical protein
MDVQTTNVPAVIIFKIEYKKEKTEISVSEPRIYIHLAMIQKMVVTS